MDVPAGAEVAIGCGCDDAPPDDVRVDASVVLTYVVFDELPLDGESTIAVPIASAARSRTSSASAAGRGVTGFRAPVARQ